MKTRFIIKDIIAPLRHLLKKMPEKNVVLILSLVVYYSMRDSANNGNVTNNPFLKGASNGGSSK